MTRFSRFRRSAGLLLLTAGICGLSAGSAWCCLGARESATPDIITASKSLAVDAYISGFKALVGTAAAQDYGSRPTVAYGSTLAQVILKQHAMTGKNYLSYNLNWHQKPAAEIVCAVITQSCWDHANEAHLESVSLKFLAMEQIETAALAHCRELALNTELCGSAIAAVVTKVPLINHEIELQLPTFAFTTVTSSVSLDAIGALHAEAAGMEASRQLLKTASPTPVVFHHVGADGLERIGVDFELNRELGNGSPRVVTPRIIIIEEEEELLLGVGSQALETEVQPLLEPELLAVNDAAPLENPAAEFVQLLPAGDDAPAENPELETSAARVVSPTMSPDEYLAAFSHRIIEDEESHGLVIPVAHEEPIQAVIPSPLQALGNQVTICDSHSPNCHGFTIQFAPQLQPMPVAEVEAFDGPAQITLHDGPNASGQGFVWPAQPAGMLTQPAGTLTQPAGTLTQPAAHTESLDELADRLEREFLARAVSGQIQIPEECAASPAVDKKACCPEVAACKSSSCAPCPPATSTCQMEKCAGEQGPPCCDNTPTCKPSECSPTQCQPGVCQPGAFGLAECMACPTGSPCGECCPAAMAGLNAAFTAMPPRSQWTLPTPAVTINPYAMGPAACGAPSTFAAPPQVGLPPQHPGSVWTPAPSCTASSYSAPTVCHVTPALPPAPNKTPVSGEALETHREISRTLEQLAERCEAQGLYTQADELRGQAQEFRMRARVIHGHLAALPLPPPPSFGQLPPAHYGQQPMAYPLPAAYYPEPAPTLTPPPAPIPAVYSQPLPIAQPMLVPRY